MVLNFVQGGAAINVFCNTNQIHLKVVDAGVNTQFDESLNIINKKVNLGTQSFFKNQAMTREELNQCL